MTKTQTLLMTLGLTSALAIVGCASEDSPYRSKEYQTKSNPASVYCVERGGALEMMTLDGQRTTFCVLENGEKVEQWEYYKQNHTQSNSTQSQ
ncbi:DUF333 domain-containing protein [Vibrio renipiscarius]|uniref:Hemolysin n=1 Tax=Vibrio renipiscarius TaxID=1461322 RepID=A0A0C2NK09_9VIBR|nr:DUF333 domain-containing protein [Vibrio renipiscarius]KII76670.1 hemolysin [Vibrio renipiscarius]KII77809.1 hemolysin [Vibrio renipiscarius]